MSKAHTHTYTKRKRDSKRAIKTNRNGTISLGSKSKERGIKVEENITHTHAHNRHLGKCSAFVFVYFAEKFLANAVLCCAVLPSHFIVYFGQINSTPSLPLPLHCFTYICYCMCILHIFFLNSSICLFLWFFLVIFVCVRPKMDLAILIFCYA